MTKFLSAGWVDELVSALNASDVAREALKTTELTIQQVVTDAPGGEVRYWITIDHGTVGGALGDAPDPDVSFAQDYSTAEALSRAELKPQAAFMQGSLKITGNMGKLLQHQSAIEELGPAMATIQAEYQGRAAPT